MTTLKLRNWRINKNSKDTLSSLSKSFKKDFSEKDYQSKKSMNCNAPDALCYYYYTQTSRYI